MFLEEAKDLGCFAGDWLGVQEVQWKQPKRPREQ